MADKDDKQTGAAAPKGRQRLTPADRAKDLLPWRRASELTRCYLYWLPVRGFPMPAAQRDWLLQFFERWSALMKAQGLRAELFLQYKIVYPNLMNPLLNNMMEFVPILGLGRIPGASLPTFPSKSEIEDMTKSMFETLQRQEPLALPDATKHMPDYSYWFLDKSTKQQLDLFFGHAGTTIAYLKPDPKTAAQPVSVSASQKRKLPMFDWEQIDKARARTASLADGFLAKSKGLFGAGLEAEPQMKGLPFILPILNSSDFFSQPAEVVENVFQLFQVYARESPADRGILLAFQADLEEELIQLLQKLTEEKLRYPEA